MIKIFAQKCNKVVKAQNDTSVNSEMEDAFPEEC
jgi:hypothetical protein